MGSPKRVAWVGDYAYDCEYTNKAKRESWYKKAGWSRDDIRVHNVDDTGESFTEGYLVNHTKHKFVDLADYCSRVGEDNWGWRIHPLPLLTVIGNGLGGGDYRGCNQHVVGRWAGDLVEYTSVRPNTSHYGVVDGKYELFRWLIMKFDRNVTLDNVHRVSMMSQYSVTPMSYDGDDYIIDVDYAV